jgi:hypothetical protein
MDTTQVAAAAAEAFNPPPTPGTQSPSIGEYWHGQGGIYIGLAAADGDLPQAHLVLATATPAGRLTWKKAMAWASDQNADGHTDFRLPTRFESALIYANGRAHVDTAPWYWTSSEHSESYAWIQDFGDGDQFYDRKVSHYAARAVRRFVL